MTLLESLDLGELVCFVVSSPFFDEVQRDSSEDSKDDEGENDSEGDGGLSRTRGGGYDWGSWS